MGRPEMNPAEIPPDYMPKNTEDDPFAVAPPQPLWLALPVFLLMLPITLSCFFITVLLCLLLLPNIRKQDSASQDWRMHIISSWMLATVRFRLRVTDHNPSLADHSTVYIASHICMFESVILINMAGKIRTIAAEFVKTMPVIGWLAEASDPIYVSRSRGGPSVVELIRESLETTSARHSIFPEGTFTNGKSLLNFKTGGFVLGHPVTPVVFKYPGYVPFWNREESTFLTQIYRMVSRLYIPLEVTILPTIYPSEAELADPKLFSAHVRQLMAWHLEVPLSSKSQRHSPNFRKDRR